MDGDLRFCNDSMDRYDHSKVKYQFPPSLCGGILLYTLKQICFCASYSFYGFNSGNCVSDSIVRVVKKNFKLKT